MNGILVGEETYRATAHAIEYREHEPIEAKGKAEPVPVWEAVGVEGGARPRPRRDAPLVGRDGGARAAARALGAACWREGRPALATLVGEPGIGKSRLLDRGRRTARPASARGALGPLPLLRRGHHLLAGRGDPRGRGRDPQERRPRDRARRSSARCSTSSARTIPTSSGRSPPRSRTSSEPRTTARRRCRGGDLAGRAPLGHPARARAGRRRAAARARLRGPALGRADAVRADRVPRRGRRRRSSSLGSARRELRELRPDFCADAESADDDRALGARRGGQRGAARRAARRPRACRPAAARSSCSGTRAATRSSSRRRCACSTTRASSTATGDLDDARGADEPPGDDRLAPRRPAGRGQARRPPRVGRRDGRSGRAPSPSCTAAAPRSTRASSRSSSASSCAATDESSLADEREWAFKHGLIRDVAYARVPKGRRAHLHVRFADWVQRDPRRGRGARRDRRLPPRAGLPASPEWGGATRRRRSSARSRR